MSRRNQMIVLGILVVVLAANWYSSHQSGGASKAPTVAGLFVPIPVDNPALRMDILERFLSLQYKGSHKNIFVATQPLPPAPPPVVVPVSVAPVVQAGPPPLTVDAKYFGFVSDSKGTHRRAFFATANNEDVFVAGEGDTLLGRFLVVRISSTSADIEEVSSKRHTTLILEEPGPNG